MISKKPSVAIVVLSWNDSKNTIECIKSILKSSYQNYDIIIVDNNSDIEHYEKLIYWCKKNKFKINNKIKKSSNNLIKKKQAHIQVHCQDMLYNINYFKDLQIQFTLLLFLVNTKRK